MALPRCPFFFKRAEVFEGQRLTTDGVQWVSMTGFLSRIAVLMLKL